MPDIKTTYPLSDADLCVMCGMCLPHCPTYQLYRTESESPRGRIALMQSIDQARIQADDVALTHIDHCLGCLNCESICPSRVPYGQLIDHFRQQFSPEIRKPLASRMVLSRTTSPGGLQPLLNISSLPVIKQALQLSHEYFNTPLPPTQSPLKLKDYYPSSQQAGGQSKQLSLFTGCMGNSVDSQTLLDASFLLNQLGFDVKLPPEQACCGALHQHNGRIEDADSLIHQHQPSPDTITLFFSPACGAQLQKISSSQFIDIRLFLIQQIQQQKLKFIPLKQSVALHESCAHRNLLKSGNLNKQLLGFIPELDIQGSKQPTICCGAGGIQAYNYPEQANALADQTLSGFDFSNCPTLLSDNIGCSLHIKSRIKRYNPEIEIMHPVSLIRQQMMNT